MGEGREGGGCREDRERMDRGERKGGRVEGKTK